MATKTGRPPGQGALWTQLLAVRKDTQWAWGCAPASPSRKATMKNGAEIVIIGGGIQGLSLAYYLTQHGASEVCLLEMNSLGSGSSGRSAAIIGYAFPSESCLPLLSVSLDALLRFDEEVGIEPGYDPIGCVLLASAEQAPGLRRRHALLEELGVETYLLKPAAISELTPGLNLEDIEVGLYEPGAACLDPHSIMMGYAQQARRKGARLYEDVRVTGLETKGDQVTGVQTTAGPVATRCVVNAAGFCAHQVAAWAGMDLPILNVKRHIFCTGPVAAYSETFPFTYEVEPTWYIRREGPGLLIGMGASPSDEEDPQVDWAFLDEVIEHSLHRAPPLEEAGVKTAWAGLRPLTPDENPVLGPAAGLRGVWNDCGWGGQGIMLAPAGGMIMAEWIMEGVPRSASRASFLAERFP
jgi:sarcosine oxidase subunit beta